MEATSTVDDVREERALDQGVVIFAERALRVSALRALEARSAMGFCQFSTKRMGGMGRKDDSGGWKRMDGDGREARRTYYD